MTATPADLLRTAGISVAVIGAQRGGSTYAADLLAERGGIDIPRVEIPLVEDPWWSRPIDPVELHKIYPPERDGRPRGLKRPDLLGMPELAPRLDAIGVEHCVVTLRDPVARTISAAHWYAYVGRIQVPDDMDEYLCRLPDRVMCGEASDHERQLLDYSMYGDLLSRWRAGFGGRLHFVTYDDLAAGLGDLSRRLGGEPTGAPVPPTTWGAVRRNASLDDVRRLRRCARRLPFAQSWDTLATFRLTRRGDRPWNPLPRRLAVAAVLAADRAVALVQRPAPSARRADTRALLRTYFADDVRRLGAEFPELRATIAEWSDR